MTSSVLPSVDQVRDLEVLILAHHPLLLIETLEDDRIDTLLAYLADRVGIGLFTWTAHRGLVHSTGGAPIAGTADPSRCLSFIEESNSEALFHLSGFGPMLQEPAMVSRMRELYRSLFEHRGAIIVSGASVSLPPDLDPLFTVVDLEPPSQHAYYQLVASVLRDLRQRMPLTVDLDSEEVALLLSHLRGLTFFEVKKVITQAVVEDGKLTKEDIEKVLETKKRIIQRTGVLDYYTTEETLADVAGLENLKAWLRKRKAAFSDPEKAKRFGLSAPKGLMLLGVQGCGKSLCAKAVAREWQLPLVRLDPSNLYNKYAGESEKNLRRAIQTAENMAPIVLWIDEIEKAFGGTGEGDSGTSQRIFGSFLSWLNDKKQSVFVIATANDISKLPPELLRKGRFDEIFFVDLPSHAGRVEIFRLHLARRNRAPDQLDLDALADATDGFSGAEIEQVVVSALYSAFGEQAELSTELLIREAEGTRPLSVTMAERIAALRQWAADRAVSAD